MMDGQMLWQLTEQACDGMLGLQIACCDDEQPGVEYALAAQIKISGEVDALLSLRSEESFARHLASSMFMVDSSELSDEEIHDALGELVNIVAGNIKGMIPGETLLSLPCVGPMVSLSDVCQHEDDVVEIVGNSSGCGFRMRYSSTSVAAVPA